MNQPIRIFIVDDHPIVRDGLRGVFANDQEFIIVGEAAHGAEALEQLKHFEVQVVLMDLRMPGMSGVETIRELCRHKFAPNVLVLTTYDADADVIAAIEAGATGYLLKDAPRDLLIQAVRTAAKGEAVLSPAVASRLIGQMRSPANDTLSNREREILELLATGASNSSIASTLFISESTVKTHLIHLYAKLGVRERAAAVGEAYRRGILSPK